MRQHRLSKTLILAGLGLAVGAAVLPHALVAATITVNGQIGDPPGTCDLTEAIDNANRDFNFNTDCTGAGPYGDDTIELTADVTLDEVYETNEGPSGLPSIISTVEIRGNDFTVRRVEWAPNFRVFRVNGNLTLQSMTVSGGSLNLHSGAGILNIGTTTLINSTVIGNSTTVGSGGGIWNNMSSVLTLTHSTVAGNSALKGGAVFNAGTADLFNSTLSENSATEGGGVYNSGTTTITNTTLSGNEADLGGGIYNSAAATIAIANATLAGNSATSDAGGIFNSNSASFRSSLLVNGSGGGNCSGSGAVTDNGANLADDDTCGSIPPDPTGVGLDPNLADNGGPTMTHALLDDTSSAIDAAGDCALLDPVLETDQRGADREGSCDSGAYEFLTCPDLPFGPATVTATRILETCRTLLVDAATVTAAGNLTVRAGKSIEVRDGTSVEADGQLTLELDPDLSIEHLNPADTRIVFVSSETVNGNLGGLAGADILCGGYADTAGLEGSFKAWLSDVARGPANSFTQAPGPYYRVDGVRIADDWEDLTDGTLKAPINVTQTGVAATATYAWTNTLDDGQADSTPGTSCELYWNSADAMHDGKVGEIQSTSDSWTNRRLSLSCNGTYALYCFEQ